MREAHTENIPRETYREEHTESIEERRNIDECISRLESGSDRPRTLAEQHCEQHGQPHRTLHTRRTVNCLWVAARTQFTHTQQARLFEILGHGFLSEPAAHWQPHTRLSLSLSLSLSRFFQAFFQIHHSLLAALRTRKCILADHSPRYQCRFSISEAFLQILHTNCGHFTR